MRGVWALLLMCVWAGSATAAPINLIQNGDFSQGHTGFTSDYDYQAAAVDSLWQPGTFGVETGSDPSHTLWERGGDHTTGTGHFMLVNGYTDQPDRTVWRQSVAVAQNTTYYFEAWAKNLCCAAFEAPIASLSFWINGLLVGGGGIDGPGNWGVVSSVWNSASASLAALEIRNSSVVFSGNDFGLDDLYLGTESSMDPVPEPASMVLLGTGLFGVVRSLRRRRV